MSITHIRKGTRFNTGFQKNCIAISDSDSMGYFDGRDEDYNLIRLDVKLVREILVEMKTMDRYPITDGMKVWDYDLELVTVDLSSMSDYAKMPDPLGQYWFYVRTESGGKKSMSDTRVCVTHPVSGKKAE